MNTANRNAQPIDFALRRRFVFQAIHPRPQLISILNPAGVASGVDLARMLEMMNKRISVLLGKPYRLGHAYFTGVQSLEGLRFVFEYQILPLLQEYFFSDIRKIGQILHPNFLMMESVETDLLFPNGTDDLAAPSRLYHLRPIQELDAGDFIRIYDPGYE